VKLISISSNFFTRIRKQKGSDFHKNMPFLNLSSQTPKEHPERKKISNKYPKPG